MIIALDKNKRPLGFLTERRCRDPDGTETCGLVPGIPHCRHLMDMDVRKLRDLPSYRIKIDPGSKYTGIALVRKTRMSLSMPSRSNTAGMRAGQDYKNVRWQEGTAEAGRLDTAGPNGGTGVFLTGIRSLITAAEKTDGCLPVS